MKKYILLLSFIHILLCISCRLEKNDMILSESESLLDADPDSALSVLQTIIYPENLSPDIFNRYILLKIQAEYKSGQDITTDSTILSVKESYMKDGNDYNIALASYYCGCYFKEFGRLKEAMENYQLALKFAEKIDDLNLKSLINNAIGFVLLDQSDPETAVRYFHESAAFDIQAGNAKNEAISYIQIGDCFQYLEKLDSAMYYYNLCLLLVEREKLKEQKACVLQNIGVLFGREGDLSKAEYYLKEALLHEPDSDGLIKIYTLLSDLYTENHQPDSAKVYMNYLMQRKDSIKDLYTKTNLYQTLSENEEYQGNYLKALEYHKIYSDNLLQQMDANLDNKLLNLQKKYDYEKVRMHNVRLKLNRTYILIALVFCIVIIICIGKISYGLYCSRLIKISELEDKMRQLTNLSATMNEKEKSFNEKEKSFRTYLLHHFNVMKKASSLELYLKNEKTHKNEFWIKKFNDIVYGQDVLDWNVLYDVINQLHDGFFIKLKEQFPQLKEIEFRIICLTYSGFSTEETSFILALSINTINTKRSAIRKKLGIEAYANLNDFLDQKLKR